MKTNNWSVMEGWNKTLTIPRKWDNEPRDVLYASEIGRSYYDTYLSLMGVPPTNEISDTIRRKMEAGNFYEAIIVWVFQRIGILQEQQVSVRSYIPNLLPIHGRLDIIAGCDGDWVTKKAQLLDLFANLDRFGFSFPFLEQVRKLSFSLIDDLSIKYPDGLESRIIEVKSLNSMAFWVKDEPIKTPYEHHKFQLSFYQAFNTLGIKDASFIYVDRDTMSLSEIPNYLTDKTLSQIEEWHKRISEYYFTKTEPSKPDLIVMQDGKYQFNWEVDRSAYKDRILEGINIYQIKNKIKQKNAENREINMMKLAMNGETQKHGIKKYIKAIDLLKQKVELEKVVKQTNVSEIAIKHYLQNE